jgi:hypothetical protein
MSEPLSTELSADARAILEAARDLDGPADLARSRVRRALLAKAAAGAGTTLAALSAAAGPSSTGALPLAKILVALAIVVAGGVGGAVAWRAQRPAAPLPVAAVTGPAAVVPAVVTRAAATTAPAPAHVDRPASPPHRAHVAQPARASAPASRLAEEMALLAASNAELRGGDAQRALALLNDYDRRYPAGVLREEVLATRVIARCRIGVAPEAAARRAADVFLTRHPASPLAPRVRSSCVR